LIGIDFLRPPSFTDQWSSSRHKKMGFAWRSRLQSRTWQHMLMYLFPFPLWSNGIFVV
jgi:hypothetical protein